MGVVGGNHDKGLLGIDQSEGDVDSLVHRHRLSQSQVGYAEVMPMVDTTTCKEWNRIRNDDSISIKNTFLINISSSVT